MDDRPIDGASLLARLEDGAIEHFWVAYHDYGGRAQAKSLPRESFRALSMMASFSPCRI